MQSYHPTITTTRSNLRLPSPLLLSLLVFLQIQSQHPFFIQCLSSPLQAFTLKNPSQPASYPITEQQKKDYQTNGFLIIPQLLSPTQIHDSLAAVTALQTQRNFATRLLYKAFPTYGNLSFQTWRTNAALEEVAFDSAASSICASLMALDLDCEFEEDNDSNTTPKRSLRLVKDAVLGYQMGDNGCDWHIDDKVFWPCQDGNYGKVDAGINVWITLSEIKKTVGGGLALAKGSHLDTEWAKTAREVIRSGGPATTCQMANLDQESWQKLEELKQVHEFQPGDAIFHNRYLFHKVDPFPEDLEEEGMKHRISLRYMPSDATYEPLSEVAAANDPAVKMKGLKKGDLMSKAGEYYPQTWPHRLPEEQMKDVLADPDFISFKKIFQTIVASTRKKERVEKEEE